MGIHLMIYISSVSLFLLFYVLYHRAHRLAVKSTLTDFFLLPSSRVYKDFFRWWNPDNFFHGFQYFITSITCAKSVDKYHRYVRACAWVCVRVEAGSVSNETMKDRTQNRTLWSTSVEEFVGELSIDWHHANASKK